MLTLLTCGHLLTFGHQLLAEVNAFVHVLPDSLLSSAARGLGADDGYLVVLDGHHNLCAYFKPQTLADLGWDYDSPAVGDA